MRFASSTLLSLALLAGSAVAHPGHDISEEIRERREFLSTAKRTNLDHCAPKLKARGVEKRNVLRREALLEKARAKSEFSTLPFPSLQRDEPHSRYANRI